MLNSEKLLRDMRIIGKEIGLWKYGYGYKYSFSRLFKDINVKGKNLLEIGCSDGRHCIRALIHGANHVVGLEPLAAGSGASKNAFKIFNEFVRSLNLKNVELLPKKIQDYDCSEGYYDIVFSVGSINHWEEDACIRLLESEDARKSYFLIFHKLAKIIKPGGKLIIIENSNRNLFGDLRIKNPLHPNIEWHKHHPPKFWAYLLSQCGFGSEKISWLTDRRLRFLGRLVENKLISYCTGSSFRLEMTCLR